MKRFTVRCIKNQIILLLAVFGTAGSVWAAQVGPGVFTSAAVIEDYENLSIPDVTAGSYVIGADTYSTVGDVLRYDTSFGALLGRAGGAIGNGIDRGYIEITLGSPALRAGLYVGVDAPWSSDVSFFDLANNILGTVSVAGGPAIGQFAGWQAESGLIGKIRVTDTLTNTRIIIIDDFIQEAVPEPATLTLFGLAMVGCLGFSRIRRQR